MTIELHLGILLNLDLGDDALQIIENAATITEKVTESWQKIWNDTIFNRSSVYWVSLCQAGLDLALIGIAISTLDLARKAASQAKKTGEFEKTIVRTVFSMLAVAIFLGNNGNFLATTIQFLKSYETGVIKTFNETQILGLSLEQASASLILNNNQKDRIDNIIAGCNDKQDTELIECLQSTVPQIEAIKQEALDSPLEAFLINPTVNYADSIINYLSSIGENAAKKDILAIASQIGATTITSTPVWQIFKILMMVIQIGMNLVIEIASILHAISLPLIVGLSFTPIGLDLLKSWLKGFVVIGAIKFFYTAILGLVSTAIVLADAQFLLDLTFMFIVGIAGPIMAYVLASGGGGRLFQVTQQAVNSRVQAITSTASNLLTAGYGKLGQLAGKGLALLGGR